MQLVVFTTIGLVLGIVTYSLGIGGAVSGLIFLLVLFTGVALRWAEPIMDRLKP